MLKIEFLADKLSQMNGAYGLSFPWDRELQTALHCGSYYRVDAPKEKFMRLTGNLPERIRKLILLLEHGLFLPFWQFSYLNISDLYRDYNKKIRTGIMTDDPGHYRSCSWCIGCGCKTDFVDRIREPDREIVIAHKAVKYTGDLCNSCHHKGVKLCDWSFDHCNRCGKSVLTLALCLFRTLHIRDLRKLIMSYIPKKCKTHCTKEM
jgi:hypothetical protein